MDISRNRMRSFAGAGTIAAALAFGLTAAPAAPAAPVPAAGPAVPEARAQAQAPAGSPVAINGQLKVCGTKLCNQFGKPIQLRGMSTHGIGWFPGCYNNGSLDVLANDWKADVLRVSMYVDAVDNGYLKDPVKYTNQVHDLIEKATARGMYVIVDWHMLGDGNDATLGDGDPWTHIAPAKKFFKEIAERHRSKNNLLFEIANEPNGKNWQGNRVDWWTVKSYAEDLIPHIRQFDPDTPVLVGTPDWASFGLSGPTDESEVVNNPLQIQNIMYTFHFYAATHGQRYLDGLSRAADKLPVFVSEFGTQNAAGEGSNNFPMTQRYLDVMAAKKISWVNWNYSDDHRSGAAFKTGTCSAGGPGPGTGSLKEAGVWVRDKIRTADNFPTN
ncbi:glycoside hydrolase family 5 protein [Streptomyces sp. NPDC051567]|uniref:glycoside hydrolase family 5 protein n=1 Tax=Streptomyces sp. NPDC051567 TaxID=3365660 RepID=UPI003790C763